ncbi:MAG TPA: FixH family protein [Spongiibacteraceae bacterium]|nr:FixH family protein [Spongiibacteraceae bacterium]
MDNRAPAIEPWHRQFWPWFLILLPSCAVVASFISLAIAMHHSDSPLRDNYSKQGFAIEPIAGADADARLRKLSAALVIASDGAIDLVLRGQLTQRSTTLTLEFIHPLDTQHDKTIALIVDSTGHYRGQLPPALDGRWLIELREPGQHWRLRGSLDLQPHRELQLAL